MFAFRLSFGVKGVATIIDYPIKDFLGQGREYTGTIKQEGKVKVN